MHLNLPMSSPRESFALAALALLALGVIISAVRPTVQHTALAEVGGPQSLGCEPPPPPPVCAQGGGGSDAAAAATAVIGPHAGAPPIAGSLTVVLTVYRRGDSTLMKQLAALDASTLRPAQVLLYQTGNLSRAVEHVLATRPDVGVVRALNWAPGVFARFSLALQAAGQMTCILDDDVVPLPRWFETVARSFAEHGEHTVVGCSGRTAVFGRQPDGSYGVGGFAPVEGRPTDEADVADDVFVDFPIHCYCAHTAFFRTYWGVPHYGAWGNGEDIAMGALAQMVAGGRVVVPRQSRADLTLGDNDTNLGADDGAVSHKVGHGSTRLEIVAHWVSRGWRPARWPPGGRVAVGGGLEVAPFPRLPTLSQAALASRAPAVTPVPPTPVHQPVVP